MDVAAVSMQMSAMQVQAQASVAVMEKAMDAQSEIAQLLIEDMAQILPMSGHIDISV